MRNPWGMSAVLGLATLIAIPAPAAAQQAVPFDSAIDVQTFEYAIGPKTFFTVADGDVANKGQVAVDALVTFMTKPFRIFNVDNDDPDMITGERTVVVESMTSAQLTLAYGATESLQVGAMLPIIFSLQGQGLVPETGNPTMDGLSVTGLGDLLLEAKLRLVRKNTFRMAFLGGLSVPTSFGSDGSQFIGDNLPTARARLAMQYTAGRLSLGANGGVLLRKPRTIYDSEIGQQIIWGGALNLRITDRFSLIGEAFGRAGIPDFSLDASPLEAIGGLRLFATPAVAIVLGGGAGLVKGIGSPETRFFLSIGYAPDVRDSDGDGIPNSRDKCITVKEDFDGSQDSDGCPDDDDDGDRRPDGVDKCPAQPEDIDGFEDDDGCPELDNDKDGLEDLVDKCPADPEDGKDPAPKDGCPANKRDSDGDGLNDSIDACVTEEEDLDGFEDADGCPEKDNDNDGLADGVDKCPVCPEDKDGFQDTDGCPDDDNDRDGIADAKDACPGEAEVLNGVKDTDGCPDTGGAIIVQLEGDRLVINKMPTLGGNKLTATGGALIDQVAGVMRANVEVTKWLVAIAHPNAAEAKKIADAVKARLVAKGVAEERLEILAAAGPAKIGGVVQERAAGDVIPMCPAGREVRPRPEKSLKGAAVGPVTPTPGGDIEMDADKDGDDIVDAEDKCPDKPETKNSFEDEDGCPDSVPTALAKFSGSVQGVNFKSGEAALLPTSLKVLDAAAAAFAQFPALKVEIQGHTDDVPPGRGGKFSDNTALSQARADTVKAYLEKKGVDGARLTAKGFGDSKPTVTITGVKGAKLKAARTKNRRVEFKLLN